MELSNNLAENAMRPIALGRKNWIHLGSKEAGPRVAAIISIVETCRRLSLPVRDYLGSVLPGLADFPINRVAELRPPLGLSATNRRNPATPSTTPIVRRLHSINGKKSVFAILDNGFVVSCPNVTKWTEWMEESFADGSHWIATDDIQGFRVETVFLGINHNVPEIEPPLWFESMVYRESADGTHGVRIKYDTLRYWQCCNFA